MTLKTPLVEYLRLTERMMRCDDEGDETGADAYRDQLDAIWRELSKEDIDFINLRDVSHNNMPCQKCADDYTVTPGLCECPLAYEKRPVRRAKAIRVRETRLEKLGYEPVSEEQRALNRLNHELYSYRTK